ncbi:WD40-repeat-containing domain protein [Gymnopilus junonius]|uniref:WD40-repeat-containing domain protein n=1 Tax=Gymnopilus junonius TaxID=109634 RepID=A0A9P5NJC9_GYMJU|nr:WD40-repeat-containing domain protein [Gymnopilus junonius]
MQPAAFQPLKSHVLKGPIRTVAFFPDGKRIVTGGHPDGTARIWNLDTGKEEGDPLDGHSRLVTNLAVSTDGSEVVTGGRDRKVLLWTIHSQGKATYKQLFSAPHNISFLAFNSTERIPDIIATASSQGIIDIWKLPVVVGPTRPNQIAITDTTVTSIRLSTGSPDLLAVVCGDRRVLVFDVHSGDRRAELGGYSATIMSLMFLPNSTRVASTAHRKVYVTDEQDNASTNEQIGEHSQTVKAIAAHPGGGIIAAGGDDKIVRVWDIQNRVEIGYTPKHPGAITNIIFSPDGTKVLSISKGKRIHLWILDGINIEENRRASPTTDDSRTPSDRLGEFFGRYPPFRYNPEAAPTSEFSRLCSFLGWRKGNDDREEAYHSFRIALTEQFNGMYGRDAQNLQSWQLLCSKVGVNPIPDSLEECRAIISDTHVNLVDLVSSGSVIKFATVDELSAYSFAEKKIFPKKDAYAGGLLKELLRYIRFPSLDRQRYA